MRITQSMLSNNMMSNIGNNYERLATLQEQIATQKKFSKPSDDPVAAMMGISYRTNLNQVQQYTDNISEATNWLDTSDSALGESISALQRIRELMVQASNGTYEEGQRGNIAEEIGQLKEHLIDIGDTQIGGKYIFNGYDSNKRPSDTMLDDGELTYSGVEEEEAGEPQEIEVEVFTGIKMSINTSGKVFQDMLKKDEGSIDQVLAVLQPDSEWSEADITKMIEVLDGSITEVLNVQAKVGAKQNRIDLMTDRLSQQEVFAQKILSNNEDVDIEKVIIEFTTQESVHSAALSIGAKLIQPSLLDFLR